MSALSIRMRMPVSGFGPALAKGTQSVQVQAGMAASPDAGSVVLPATTIRVGAQGSVTIRLSSRPPIANVNVVQGAPWSGMIKLFRLRELQPTIRSIIQGSGVMFGKPRRTA